MTEVERWAKVGERIDKIRGAALRSGLDVGGFFDRPPPRRWIAPAFLAAMFFAGSAYNVFATGDAFARGFSCACGIFWGVEMLGKAWARRGVR